MYLEYIGVALGVLSIIVSWHYGSRTSRRRRKILLHEEELAKIQNYSKTTGYKYIIHDSFSVLFYALSIFLIALGLQQILLTIITNTTAILFIKQITAGAYIGSGGVLLESFITLANSYKPEAAVEKISGKIEKLQNDV